MKLGGDSRLAKLGEGTALAQHLKSKIGYLGIVTPRSTRGPTSLFALPKKSGIAGQARDDNETDSQSKNLKDYVAKPDHKPR